MDGSDVPAFERPVLVGTGGITPPGGNNGSPASCVGGGADLHHGSMSVVISYRISQREKSSWVPASWSNSSEGLLRSNLRGY